LRQRTPQLPGYFVYMLASHTKTLYTGVTSNLLQRVYQHKKKITRGFTSKYNVDRLVHLESTGDVMSAIEREKQIKSWTRAKKVALIQASNPDWKGLAFSWYEPASDEESAVGAAAPAKAASGDSSFPSE
jgi:putative endonuclease